MTGFAGDFSASASIRSPKLPSRLDAPTIATERASSIARSELRSGA
jgi:hypothetical protein